MAKLYCTDYIKEDYKTWDKQNVFLDCGTGTGKTHFIFYTLLPYLQEKKKTVLYLYSRTAMTSELNKIGKKFENLELQLYQSFACKIKQMAKLPHYDYVVYDEIHYIITDSWNNQTQYIYEYIEKRKNESNVFMSATAKAVIQKLLNEKFLKQEFIYTLPQPYHYVDHLYFFRKNGALSIIKNVLKENKDDKVICFVKSYKDLYSIYEQMGNKAHYFCSKNTDDYKIRKICTFNDFQDLEVDLPTNKRQFSFNKRVLVTTSALDVGFSLLDRNIKHIICDMPNCDTLIQCLGRKRSLDDDDTCNFYICDYSPIISKNKTYGGVNRDLNKKRKELDYIQKFENLNGKELMDALPFDNNNFRNFAWGDLRNKSYKINPMKVENLKIEIEILEKMNCRNGYIKYISQLLKGVKQIHKIPLERINEVNDIESFLNNYCGKKFYVDERDTICTTFNIRNPQNGRLIKSLNQFNQQISESKLPYEIICKRESYKDQYHSRETYWKIVSKPYIV